MSVVLRLLAHVQRQQRWLLWTAALAGAASGLATGALASVIHRALGAPERMSDQLGAFAALCAIMMVSRVGSEIALVRMTQDALRNLRLDLAQRLLSTPLARLQGLGKPRLLAILTEDIGTVANAVEWIPPLFVNGVLLAACAAYLLWVGGWLVLPLLGFVLAGALSFHALESRAIESLTRVREGSDALHRHWRGLVEGTKELQLNEPRRHAFLASVLSPATDRLRRSFVAGMSRYVWASAWGNLLFYALIGFALFGLARWVTRPTDVWIGLTLTLLFMIRPITDVMMALPMMRRATIAFDKIDQLAAALDRDADGAPPASTDVSARPSIELVGVRYRYQAEHDDRPFELGPIDLALRAGEITFLAGGNGSGKSTLGLLIAGLYAPDAGQLLCDGAPVTSEKERAAYRQHFSAIFAEFHLFEELLAAPGVEPAAAQRYLERLGVAHRVRIDGDRFSTVELSTGQRKRVALVLAYLDDRPVYLFDEWAADQDPEFKRVFYRELLPELRSRGKTVLVVTHDDAYFTCADRLVRMERGRIVSDETRTEGSLRAG
jgi:putative pyoverdin transport system ATP-binding/permease protein